MFQADDFALVDNGAEQSPAQSVLTRGGLDDALTETFPASDSVAVTGDHAEDKPAESGWRRWF